MTKWLVPNLHTIRHRMLLLRIGTSTDDTLQTRQDFMENFRLQNR